jgi:hypothetical protein
MPRPIRRKQRKANIVQVTVISVEETRMGKSSHVGVEAHTLPTQEKKRKEKKNVRHKQHVSLEALLH